MSRKYIWMHKPCANCPFLKRGFIELRPGRVRGIIDFLLRSDFHGFPCHKTTQHDGEESDYTPRLKDKECAGAMIYRLKAKQPSVYMRVGMMFKGGLDPDRLMRRAGQIIDHPYRGKR